MARLTGLYCATTTGGVESKIRVSQKIIRRMNKALRASIFFKYGTQQSAIKIGNKRQHHCNGALHGEIWSTLQKPFRQPALLHFVELLVNQQRQKSQQKHSRANTEHSHREDEAVDLGQ